MGLELTITFASDKVPRASGVPNHLTERGFPVHLQMIDGQLAFPDELPSEDWKELRFGTPAGMVTVRRSSGQLVLLVWGNADAALLQARNALAWALARETSGTIQTTSGPLDAVQFEQQADLPGPLRGATPPR